MTHGEMISEYSAWCVSNGLPALSADELLFELCAVRDGEPSSFIAAGSVEPARIRGHLEWLSRFIDRWNEKEGTVTYAELEQMAAIARPIDDDEWASQRQIDAENAFFEAAGPLGEAFEAWALHATTDEMLDEALRILKARHDESVAGLAQFVAAKGWPVPGGER